MALLAVVHGWHQSHCLWTSEHLQMSYVHSPTNPTDGTTCTGSPGATLLFVKFISDQPQKKALTCGRWPSFLKSALTLENTEQPDLRMNARWTLSCLKARYLWASRYCRGALVTNDLLFDFLCSVHTPNLLSVILHPVAAQRRQWDCCTVDILTCPSRKLTGRINERCIPFLGAPAVVHAAHCASSYLPVFVLL